jgi:hypothetical protein
MQNMAEAMAGLIGLAAVACFFYLVLVVLDIRKAIKQNTAMIEHACDRLHGDLLEIHDLLLK